MRNKIFSRSEGVNMCYIYELLRKVRWSREVLTVLNKNCKGIVELKEILFVLVRVKIKDYKASYFFFFLRADNTCSFKHFVVSHTKKKKRKNNNNKKRSK